MIKGFLKSWSRGPIWFWAFLLGALLAWVLQHGGLLPVIRVLRALWPLIAAYLTWIYLRRWWRQLRSGGDRQTLRDPRRVIEICPHCGRERDDVDHRCQ